MKAKIIVVTLLLVMFFPFLGAAEEKTVEENSNEWTPLQVAIWEPVQLFGFFRN